MKMLRLRILRVVPIKPSIIVKSWRLIEKYHIYQANAIQIVSSREINAEEFYTGDKTLCTIAELEGLKQGMFRITRVHNARLAVYHVTV